MKLSVKRELHMSAASGIVRLHGRYYIVSDDETDLFIYPENWNADPIRLPLFPKIDTTDPKERKKLKPDGETILVLKHGPVDSILVLPSGSTARRMQAALVTVRSPDSAPNENDALRIDCSPLYNHLLTSFPELNIEGATADRQSLRLFQRGNGARGENAIIALNLARVLDDIQKRACLSAESLLSIDPIPLGTLNGIPLAFTDAAIDSEGATWFLAVAEDSQSTYHDGAIAGSILGRLDASNRIAIRQQIPTRDKPEGLCPTGLPGQFLLVTDADDPQRLSKLYELIIPRD